MSSNSGGGPVRWLRVIGAVVAGYLFSQGLNALHVLYWHVADRSVSDVLLVPWTIVGFLVVGLLTGVLAGRIGGDLGQIAAPVLAGLIVMVTFGNIVMDVAAEPLWHKLVVLLVMAPAIVWSARRWSGATRG